MAGTVDLLVNSISMLMMTPSWQPAFLKKLTAKITAATVQKKEENVMCRHLGEGPSYINIYIQAHIRISRNKHTYTHANTFHTHIHMRIHFIHIYTYNK